MESPATVPLLTRRVLHDATTLRVGHIVARPANDDCIDVEAPTQNVLALPLSGLFARHLSSRTHWIATPGHAVFFPAGRGYRMSFPGAIGDEVLVLQWSPEALGEALPEAAQRFEGSVGFRVLLEPGHMLRRARLRRRLEAGALDPLEIEEECAGLLASCLRIEGLESGARRDRVERVKEAIAVDPARAWTLAELSRIALLSPYHLAHVFRRQVGVPVYAYVLRSRLAAALGGVLDTDADITSIALDHGFSSHSHFTHRFRALFGVTPASLRRERPRGALERRKIVTARWRSAS
jgi:AraC-like DNA-binding protein